MIISPLNTTTSHNIMSSTNQNDYMTPFRHSRLSTTPHSEISIDDYGSIYYYYYY